MRLTRLTLLAFVLVVPAAHADGLETLQSLAKRNIKPAPLVPTTAPGILTPLSVTLTTSPALSKHGYALRMVHYTAYGPDAVIALSRGDYKTVRAALHDLTKPQGFTAKRTRIRGKRGYLLTGHHDVREWELLWSEDGRVYEMGTGTPKKISVKKLRATAAGLDHLERDYVGDFYDQNTGNDFGVVIASTQHTVSGNITFGGTCTMANGLPGSPHAGQADFFALRRQGNSFSVPFGSDIISPPGWTGSISGTVSPNAIVVNGRVTGSFDGDACDSGPFTVTADQRPKL
jgi:hypothetical protein